MEMVISNGAGDSLTVNETGGVVTESSIGAVTFITGVYTPGFGLTIQALVGQFQVETTGEGHGDVTQPTLADLNQIQASTSRAAGTLNVVFTDTGYTDFGIGFLLGVSGTNDKGIIASTADFSTSVDAANAIPAGTLVGSIDGETGNPTTSYSTVETFTNPIGTSGSLTEHTTLHFTGQGAMQANFTISAVPEPASVLLFGGVLLLSTRVLRKKLRKV